MIRVISLLFGKIIQFALDCQTFQVCLSTLYQSFLAFFSEPADKSLIDKDKIHSLSVINPKKITIFAEVNFNYHNSLFIIEWERGINI